VQWADADDRRSERGWVGSDAIQVPRLTGAGNGESGGGGSALLPEAWSKGWPLRSVDAKRDGKSQERERKR
jgi:hypothetical protein